MWYIYIYMMSMNQNIFLLIFLIGCGRKNAFNLVCKWCLIFLAFIGGNTKHSSLVKHIQEDRSHLKYIPENSCLDDSVQRPNIFVKSVCLQQKKEQRQGIKEWMKHSTVILRSPVHRIETLYLKSQNQVTAPRCNSFKRIIEQGNARQISPKGGWD